MTTKKSDRQIVLEQLRRTVGRIAIKATPDARDIRKLADALCVVLEEIARVDPS